MAIRVGINGFGRIGRQVLKIMKEEKFADKIDVVAFNDLGNLETMAHLFRHDSTYGGYDGKVEVKDGAIVVDGDEIKALAERDPAALPWGDMGVDIVIESTGIFRKRDQAALHIKGGAKKVIISAPSPDPDVSLCLGVNDDAYKPAEHHVISNASCTTNCLAPPAKVLNDKFGIEKGVMTTIHAYTSDQNILDAPHKDLRRARSAAVNIIPTSTGAAKAVGIVIPALKGKVDGMAVRVPTVTGSLVDFVAILGKDTTKDEVIAAFEEAAAGSLKGILNVSHEPLVSGDYIGNAFSSTVDALATTVNGNMIKLIAWYDNEWGYSVRVVDLVIGVGEKL